MPLTGCQVFELRERGEEYFCAWNTKVENVYQGIENKKGPNAGPFL
jgi:hypothetical protein